MRSVWNVGWNLVLLGCVVATNMLALYSLSISRHLNLSLRDAAAIYGSLVQELVSVRNEIRSTQQQLLHTRIGMQQIHKGMMQTGDDAQREMSVGGFSGRSEKNGPVLLASELREYTEIRGLPLGRNPSNGEESMVSPIGYGCYQSLQILEEYMNYTVGQLCPDDWDIAQNLMLRGCEPLPRRRCFSRTPPSHSQPLVLPQCLWASPSDDTILWTHYTCKSFGCLRRRAKESKVFHDCADCFDLDGPERVRWVVPRDRFDIVTVEQILAMKKGTIRIGLDIGGGVGSFAARMKEHNVTIITTSLNLNGPFNEFVALRGLLPLYTTVSQRLPFFDNTLDLVHSMHVLSHWIPITTLEFILYDIDRVLRPGGLFWLDHFFCNHDQLASIFSPMIAKLGYIKHGWVTGNKTDPNGLKNKEVYLSALLEKPIREASGSSN